MYSIRLFNLLLIAFLGGVEFVCPAWSTTSSPPELVNLGAEKKQLAVSESGSPPRDVQARALSYTTVVVDWERPEQPLGQISGYRVYFTSNPSLPLSLWEYLDVDDSQLTTISELQRETIYTIRVSAITTSRGEGPLSSPVQVKTKQGVPNQPSGLQAVALGPHSIKLTWKKAQNVGENIQNYDIYWNDTFENNEGKQTIPDSDTYIIENLYPDTLYYIWIAARSNAGDGAATPPIAVRTELFGAPPQEVHGQVVDSRTLKISWKPPPPTPEMPIGNITYYKVIVTQVNEDSSDISENNIDTDDNKNTNSDKVNLGSTNEDPSNTSNLNTTFNSPNSTNYSYPNVTNSSTGNIEFTTQGPDNNSFIIENLEEWTSYSIKVLAGTSMGEGPASKPIILRTEEAVPGEPRDVKAVAINSTAIRVEWNPPSNIDQHGVRRGYQIYVHEMSSGNREEFLNDPIKFDVLDPNHLQSIEANHIRLNHLDFLKTITN